MPQKIHRLIKVINIFESVMVTFLWVADTANVSIGLRFILPSESLPMFICLPRDESLGIMNNGQRICKDMQSCASTQCQSITRGTNNQVFTENGNQIAALVQSQEGQKEVYVWSVQTEIRISIQGMGFYSQGSEVRRVCI